MENLNQPTSSGAKQMLPNATIILVLGICSIVFSCAFVGLVLGIIAVVMAGKPRKLYKENPAPWDGWSQVNAGYVMGIIGICLGGLYVIYALIWGSFILAMFSGAAAANPY